MNERPSHEEFELVAPSEKQLYERNVSYEIPNQKPIDIIRANRREGGGMQSHQLEGAEFSFDGQGIEPI